MLERYKIHTINGVIKDDVWLQNDAGGRFRITGYVVKADEAEYLIKGLQEANIGMQELIQTLTDQLKQANKIITTVVDDYDYGCPDEGNDEGVDMCRAWLKDRGIE